MKDQPGHLSLEEFKEETAVVLRKAVPEGSLGDNLIEEVRQTVKPRELISIIDRAILQFNLRGIHQADLESIKGLVKATIL